MSKLVRNIILFAVVIASTKTLASPPGDDFFIRFETSSPSDCATDTKMTHKILIGLKDSSMDRYEGQFEFLNKFQYIEAECSKPMERVCDAFWVYMQDRITDVFYRGGADRSVSLL